VGIVALRAVHPGVPITWTMARFTNRGRDRHQHHPRAAAPHLERIHEAQVALRRRPAAIESSSWSPTARTSRVGALAAAQAAAQEDGLKISHRRRRLRLRRSHPHSARAGRRFREGRHRRLRQITARRDRVESHRDCNGRTLCCRWGRRAKGSDTIFKTVLGPLAKHDLASRQQRIYIERYQWPLAASLLALLASLLIGTRRRGSARKPRNPRSTVALSLLLLIDLAAHAPRTAAAGAGAESGGSPTAGGATAGLATAGTASTGTAPLDPKAPVLEFNAGTARIERPVSAGGAGVPAIDQSCPVERSATPGRSRGRLLQPRQHAVSRRQKPKTRRPRTPFSNGPTRSRLRDGTAVARR